MPSENIKITCSTEDLDAKLSKSMQALGAHHDQYGRLVNAEGKFIAGLTQARIRMGDWIDTMGRARDVNGNYLDGLTSSELKLRMYRDELGNVRDATGQLIRINEERIAALDEEGKRAVQTAKEIGKEIDAIEKASQVRIQSQKASEAFAKSLSSIGGMAGNLSQVSAIFAHMGGSSGEMAKSVSLAAQKVQLFVGLTNAVQGMQVAIKAVTVATKGQTLAQAALNLVSGNWVTIGIAAVAFLSNALMNARKEKEKQIEREKEHQKALDEINRRYERLTDTLKKHNTYIQAGRIEQAGFLNSFVRETKEIEKATRQLEIYQKAYGILKEEQGLHGDGGKKWRNYQEAGLGMAEKIDAQQKEVATQINALVSKDLAGAAEIEQLKERAAYYTKVMEKGILEGAALANAQKALANNLDKQSEIIAKEAGYGDFLKKAETKIVQPKTLAEFDAAIKKAAEDLGEGSAAYQAVVANMKSGLESALAEQAASKLADAQKALGEKFQSYADGSALWTAQEKAAADLESTIAVWTANFEAAGKSQAELDAAISNLKKEFDDRRLQEYLNANGLRVKEQQHLDALDRYNDTLDKIKEAQETYGLRAAEAEKLRAEAAEDYAGALAQKAEDEERQRQARLTELGITQMRETMKTPLQKFLEQQQKIITAQQEGLIGAAEAQAISARLAFDYRQGQQEVGADRAPGFEREEYKAAANLTAGSNELYLAMTQRESATERYQTDVTKNLNNMNRHSAENNEILLAIQGRLGEVMKAVGVI